MKKLKLIYNPNSGNKGFRYDIDACIHIFQEAGYEIHIFKSQKLGDIDAHLSALDIEYDAIVISGGDGSVNIVVNAMFKYGLKMPLGIIPSGTANDFATFLKLPAESDNAAEVIGRGKKMLVDVGIANDRYFINVCGAGLLTNISQNIDANLKSTFGKLAYYIKGIEQIPNFVPMKMQIKNSRETINENLYFYIVLNSAGTGGFTQLSPGAQIDDGLFDFIGFKEMPLIDLPLLFVKILKGEYLDDPRVIFFRDSYIRVENMEESEIFSETDVDGERGPDMPIEIRNIPKSLEIFIP